MNKPTKVCSSMLCSEDKGVFPIAVLRGGVKHQKVEFKYKKNK